MSEPSSSWPPSNGLTTPRVPRESVILPNYASARVNAPASVVFQTVLDTSTYPDWCTWVDKVTIHSQPSSASQNESKILHRDTSFTFRVMMQPQKKRKDFNEIQLRVTDISTPSAPSSYIPDEELQNEECYTADLSKTWRVAWTAEGGFVNRGLKTERFHEVIEINEGECEVRTWECQGGVLARAVKYWYAETLRDRFNDWCDDLKKYCEKKVQEDGGGGAETSA